MIPHDDEPRDIRGQLTINIFPCKLKPVVRDAIPVEVVPNKNDKQKPGTWLLLLSVCNVGFHLCCHLLPQCRQRIVAMKLKLFTNDFNFSLTRGFKSFMTCWCVWCSTCLKEKDTKGSKRRVFYPVERLPFTTTFASTCATAIVSDHEVVVVWLTPWIACRKAKFLNLLWLTISPPLYLNFKINK